MTTYKTIRLTKVCQVYLLCFQWVAPKEMLFLGSLNFMLLMIGSSSMEDIAESNDVIHKHHDELCNTLDTSEPILLRLAGKAYTKSTINEPSSSSLALLDSVFKQKDDFAKPSDVIHKRHDDQSYVEHDKESIIEKKKGKTTMDVIDVSLRKDEKEKTNNPDSSSLAIIDSAFPQKHKIAKPSDVICKRHDELCNMLDTFEPTLLRFAGKAYSERIIDMPTRREIQHKMGYRGAATLLDIIEWKVKVYPDLIITVLEIMEELEYLKSIAKHMRDEVYQIEEQWKQHLAIGKFVIIIMSCILLPFCLVKRINLFFLFEMI